MQRSIQRMRFIVRHGIAVSAGIAIGWSGLHPAWAPLQFVAFAALATALNRVAGWERPASSFLFGAALCGTLLVTVEMLPVLKLALFFGTAVWWTFLGWGVSGLLGQKNVSGAFAACGLVVLAEWAQTSAFPLFGTAQRFASAWTEYPSILPLSRLGGTLLITMALCAASFSLGLSIVAVGRERIKLLCVVAIVGTSVALASFGPKQYGTRLEKVAVIGAKNHQAALLKPEEFWRLYGPYAQKAASQGATLVVFPELALAVSRSESGSALATLALEAKRLGVTFALGFRQERPHRNLGVLLNTLDAPVSAIYDKSHWVPFEEHYDLRGDGIPLIATSITGLRIGLMICQDDNFEQVSRRMSLADVQMAVVPTLDWHSVERLHLTNARNRSKEFGFVTARATIGGISAIIDPTGVLVASMNHLTQYDGVVIAEIMVPEGGPTSFARFGDWPSLLLAGAGLIWGIRRAIRGRDRVIRNG